MLLSIPEHKIKIKQLKICNICLGNMLKINVNLKVVVSAVKT